MPQQTLQQFGQTIKAKHPEYADMSDEDVANKVLAKYPQYHDMVSPAPPSTNGATIQAAPNTENSITNYFHDLGTDLSQGGSRTGIGRILGTLQGRSNGYSGLVGGGEGAANFLGSPELGVAKTLEGLASIPQHPIAGPLKAAAGALQAATIPSMMMNPAGAIESVPSKKYAGQVLQNISERAGQAGTEVPLNDALAPLQRLTELGARGNAGRVPAGVNQLLERSQMVAPMDYRTAQDFASAISKMSASERMAAVPEISMEVGNLSKGLRSDIANSLQNLGLSDDYMNAIREYARAAQRNQAVGNAAKTAAKYGALGIAGALGAHKVYEVGRKLAGQ